MLERVRMPLCMRRDMYQSLLHTCTELAVLAAPTTFVALN